MTRRVEGLDVVRGVAVALVILRHAFDTQLGGAGIVGVGLFFVLSGYLITGLIVRDLDSQGRPRWLAFYAHRAFRLLPALVLLLTVYAVVEIIWSPLGLRSTVPISVLVGLTYTADLPISVQMGSLGHLWSLAIEEQFYLIWPAFLWIVSRKRLPLAAVVLVTGVALTAFCWATLLVISPASHIYTYPTTWASLMAFGALARVGERRIRRMLGGRLGVAAVISVVVLGALSIVPDAKEHVTTYLAWPTIIAVAGALIILKARDFPQVPVPLRPLVWIGYVSYAAYLWNFVIVRWLALGGLSWWEALASIPLTLAAAGFSWFTVEAAGRKARARFDAKNLSVVRAR